MRVLFEPWCRGTTIKSKRPHPGPLAFGRAHARESKPRPGRTPGSERTAGMNCFMPGAERTACACRRKRGLQGRFPPAPPFTRARKFSGPFSFGFSPGKRGAVLRVTWRPRCPKWPFSGREPSLFSVWLAGRRRGCHSEISDLNAPVRRQPRPPVRLRTPQGRRLWSLDGISIEIHNCGN